MITKYNAVIVVRGKSQGVTSTKRIENKPMPFILNYAKGMANHINEMAYESGQAVPITAETLTKIKYIPILSSINIRFKKVK